MEKTGREQTVEMFAIGGVLVLFALLLLGVVPGPWFALLSAVILLGSASYQRAQGWSVNPLTWLFGGLFAVLSALQVIGALLNLALGIVWNIVLPVAVVGFLVWFIFFKDRE